MNNLALDVVIGIVFVYLLYGILASVIHEMAAHICDLRARMLKRGIARMLEDSIKSEDFVDKFYKHPSVKYLAEERLIYNKPSYMGASNFSQTMIYLLRGDHWNRRSDPSLEIENRINSGLSAYKNAPDTYIKPEGQAPDEIPYDTLIHLNNLFQDANGDLAKFKENLEKWFDDTMERVTGWYKRGTHVRLFVIGFIIAIIGNVDTIKIYHVLSTDEVAREQMVKMAIEQRESYATLINRDRESNPTDTASEDPILMNDSIFKATFQLVFRDAKNAQNIMGTGWRSETKLKIVDSLRLLSEDSKKKIAALRLDTLPAAKAEIKKLDQQLKKYSERIEGINTFSWDKFNGFLSILGWLLTAIALSFGAPFWFDLLNKLVNIRAAGKKPEDDKKAKKQDQTNTSTPLGQEKIKVTAAGG